MTPNEWNEAYVTHIREVVALIQSMTNATPESICKQLTALADQIETTMAA